MDGVLGRGRAEGVGIRSDQERIVAHVEAEAAESVNKGSNRRTCLPLLLKTGQPPAAPGASGVRERTGITVAAPRGTERGATRLPRPRCYLSSSGAGSARLPGSRRSPEVPVIEETQCQIDNARTRVTSHRLAPGAHTGFHRHEYDYVVVPVTSGRMRIVASGKESFAELSSGVAYFRPAGVEHDVFNGGDGELIFVEVELIS